MSINGKNFLGNEESSNGEYRFRAVNPASEEQLEVEFTEATVEEVDKAIQKAEAAFPVFSKLQNKQRADFLEAIAFELLEAGDELISRCMSETALPEARLNGERMRTVNQLKLFASVIREGSWVNARIDTAQPDRSPVPKPDIRQMQQPLGPVGIFGASNFPLAFSVAGGDTASALAAGCPVVVKAHPLHPGTSELVGRAILKAANDTGMPEGVFSLVQGTSVDVGMAIVTHPLITAIGFTGSFRGGKAIFDAANQRKVPIPVFAEMGSTNPVFLLPGAINERGDAIASGLANSINLGVGQFCTNPGLLISEHSDSSEKLVSDLAASLSEQSGGTMLSASIKQSYDSGIDEISETFGVAKLTSDKETAGNTVSGHIFTTDDETFISNPSLAEEVFGPSSVHVSASSKDKLLEIARSLEGHLTATIHGTEQDLEEYAELVTILERKVGRLIFNGYPTGVEVCHSMVHGGPFPATTAPQSTSVGTLAIYRFSRPVCYQDFPQSSLPDALKDGNPLGIHRMVDGEIGK